MSKNPKIQTRLQQLYGVAPEAFRADLSRACQNMKEEAAVKKASGLMLAFGLMLLLAGAALAAQQLGAFAFLFPSQAPPAEVQQKLQTQFSQAGGAMETVDVVVLDAVTDGLSAFMAVEVRAKSAKDVLFSEYDSKGLREAPADDRRRLIFWQPDEMGENLYLRGREWKRIDDQTLLLHYIIDLQGQEVPEAQSLKFEPGVRVQKESGEATGMEDELERGLVQVTLHPQPMEQIVRSVQVPFDIPFLEMTVIAGEITFTPLATYLRLEYSVPELAPEDWQDKYSNLWFNLEDGKGGPIQSLSGGRKRSDDGSEIYQELQERLYRQTDSSIDTLVLIPYISHTMEAFDPVELPLL